MTIPGCMAIARKTHARPFPGPPALSKAGNETRGYHMCPRDAATTRKMWALPPLPPTGPNQPGDLPLPSCLLASCFSVPRGITGPTPAHFPFPGSKDGVLLYRGRGMRGARSPCCPEAGGRCPRKGRTQQPCLPLCYWSQEPGFHVCGASLENWRMGESYVHFYQLVRNSGMSGLGLTAHPFS